MDYTQEYNKPHASASEKYRTYYWVATVLGQRLIVIGPKSTEEEANEFAYSKLDTPFQIVPLQTRDSHSATRQIKAMRLEFTGDLRGSTQNARHTV